MSGERIHRKPAFFWQAVLILLPVAILAVIGWVSLRQDKMLAEHDAQQRAQVFADQLAPLLWAQLNTPSENDSTNQVAFQVDESGKLIFPPPYDPAPAPSPLPLEQLSPEQARLWAMTQTSTADAPTNAADACQRFINSNPPKRFAAAAQYQLGLLLLQRERVPSALKSLELVASQYPDVTGESGLPLGPLAQFKLIEHEAFPVGSFCSNIVYRPTLLTPFLLGQIEKARTNQLDTVQKWQRVWKEHERAREIFAAASDHLRSSPPFLPVGTNQIENAPIPSIFWFTLSEQASVSLMPNATVIWVPAADGDRVFVLKENWLAMRVTTGTNSSRFICHPESDLGLQITRNTQFLPVYFGVGVVIAGEPVSAGVTGPFDWHYEYVPGGKGGGQHWEKIHSGTLSTNLLASSALADGKLKVNVYLTNRSELFAAQHSRAMWFALLVIASTVAALIGFFAAARAFYRQQHLAEMKSNFVSSVSHELRAPIASVRLMAESLERGKVNEAQKQNEYFRFIVQECRRLSALIENVLDFSRIEQGRKQYELEPTDLLALTRETVKLMEPYAEEKGVKLETFNIQHPTSNIELEVDGRAIQQALVNLIDNAIKHSAKGQTVTVGLDAERAVGVPPASGLQPSTNETDKGDPETGGKTVLLFVEDHGPGIPPGEREKIFERFYRLGSELRRETQGVGIGLSIVKHIVEAHGGRVTVRSNVGQGSRFTIVLPCNPLNK